MSGDTARQFDEQMMRRAIRLAMNGRGRVEPNPMVGCVITSRDGRVIGEGWHKSFGGPHTEREALAACVESPEGATAYVTLEPCCHTNKKTPPCVPALIEAKVARVVIGCLDPNPEVNGKGVAQLREAGIVVEAPVLDRECRQLLAPFMAYVDGRPYVTLKWAQSADGKVAGPKGQRRQISNARSARAVQHIRARCDAIMVGVRTVMNDNPILTARVEGARRLSRVVLDPELRVPFGCRLVNSRDLGPVIVYCSQQSYALHPGRVEQLRALGAEVVALGTRPDGHLWLGDLMLDMGARGVTHCIVEPGPTLAAGAFDEGVADRVWVFRSQEHIADATAPSAVRVPADYVQTGQLDLAGDTLTEYLNPASPVFFAAEPSADFVLTAEAVRQGTLG